MRRVQLAMLGLAAGYALVVELLDPARGGQWASIGIFFAALAVGFPVLYYCCKRGYWEPWRMILLGSLGGGLCALPFAGGPFSFGFLLLILLLAGAGLGLLFWIAAIWRNDDLTCRKSFCLPCGTVYKVARGALGFRR
jgi:hypothetical protein